MKPPRAICPRLRARIRIVLLLVLAPFLAAGAFAAHYVGDALNPAQNPPVSSFYAWSYTGSPYSESGKSVSAGDITGDGFSDILVGAPFLNYLDVDGRIFMFTGSPTGVSPEPLQQYVKIQEYSAFGFSVSVVGDVNGDGFADAVVGAPLFDAHDTDEGQVNFYPGSATGLVWQSEQAFSGTQTAEYLGYCVAGAGDVNGDGYDDVIAGAPFYDGSWVDEGRVLLFLGGPNGIASAPASIVEGSQAECGFGTSVASAGDVNRDGYCDVIVGAPYWDGSTFNEGAVFLFLGSPTGLALEPFWSATGGLADCRFGNAVAAAGDVDGDGHSDIIIGAPQFSTIGNNRDGRVFVYRGSPDGIMPEPYWELTWSSREYFGLSVATAGDVDGNGLSDILVGSLTIQTTQPREYAYLFLSLETGISTTPDWRARETIGLQNTGIVSSAGDVNGDGFFDVLIGDPHFKSPDCGRALVYHAIPVRATLAQEPDRILAGPQPDAWFGASVAGSGDVNGDGRVDVIVGAPFYEGSGGGAGGGAPLHGGPGGARSPSGSSGGVENAGAAFLYAGTDSGFGASPLWNAEGRVLWGWFGFAAAFAGDVNGDGFDDVLVGAPRHANGEADEGAAYLYLGSEGGPEENASWMGEGDQEGAEYGFSVARAGDTNGDGYSDFIVGAFRHGNGQDEEGRAYVYYGTRGGPSDARRWIAESGQDGAWFGYAVAGAGDINGDGFSDVMVGAPYYDNGETDEGCVFIYAGSENGLPDAPTWTVEIDREIARLGIAVAAAGDVNGDGYGDILIGAEGYFFELEDIGSVFLYYGSETGPLSDPVWSARGDPLSGGLGKSVAAAGDLNCDGFSDVVIGDPFFDGDYTDQGRVVVFTGSARGLTDSPAWILEGTQAEEWFGYAVASVGDINGDGVHDVFVGAPRRSDSDGGGVGGTLQRDGNPQRSESAQRGGVGETLQRDGDPQRSESAQRGGAGLLCTTSGLSRIRLVPRQMRSDGSAQVGLLGYSGDRETFRLATSVRPPAGAATIFIEYEFKPRYLPFDFADIKRGPLHRLTPAERASRDPIELEDIVDPPGTPERGHWRFRICTDVPYAQHTRWVSHSYNTTAEADIRLWVNPVGETPSYNRPEESGALVLHLGPNYPNPCNPASIFIYSTSRPVFVTLRIYDVLGRPVRTLVEDWRSTGEYRAAWDGRNTRGEQLASGIYFLRLEAEGTVRARKIAVLR